MRRLFPAILCACAHAAAAPPPAAAGAAVEAELVESAPVETTLDDPSVANAPDVWPAMIAAAKKSIDFGEFYASEAEPQWRATSRLTPVLDAIAAAVRRGVKVRFLADAGFGAKYPESLEALARAGVEVRRIDFAARGGGVLHAKYFIVDGEAAFVGSQNFDWRALSHIFEMGVRLRSRELAGELADVFETDWALAAGAPAAERVHRHRHAAVTAESGERLELFVSPKGWLPDEAEWDLPHLVALLDGARQAIDLQVLTYKTRERDGTPFLDLDQALRRAAARGVKVRLLVSSWGGKGDGLAALQALAGAGVTVKILTIPPWSGGDIPFARVAHAKYLIVDGHVDGQSGTATDRATAWIGTSNWEGDYFLHSRNLAVVAQGGKLPAQAQRVFERGWASAYAAPLTPR